MLLAPVEIDGLGRSLFSSHKDYRLYGPDFRNYVRQAHVYDEAASRVPGSSKSLLQYYAVLQLAKAELLIQRPNTVFNTRVGHGLSFHPEAAKTFRGDYLRVAPGVFSELYEVRTGSSLPAGSRLRVVDLLRSCSDITYEAIVAGLGSPNVSPIQHFVAFDSSRCWSVFSLDYPDPFLNSSSTMRALRINYEQVKPTRLLPLLKQPEWVFESRYSVPIQDAPDLTVIVDQVCERALDDLAPFLGIPLYSRPQAAASLLRSRFVPMPPDLARYAVTFYLSSVVRYKPSRLDPSDRSTSNWVMDAFSAEAGLHLLRAALCRISRTLHVLQSPVAAALGLP